MKCQYPSEIGHFELTAVEEDILTSALASHHKAELSKCSSAGLLQDTIMLRILVIS